jgi:hypothetical protein
MTTDNVSQSDLLSDVSELDLVRHLLADLHDDLAGAPSSAGSSTSISISSCLEGFSSS